MMTKKHNQSTNSKKKLPYFAIGNEELVDKPTAGKYIKCKICGKKHLIEYGTSKTLLPNGKWSKPIKNKLLGFYKCGKNSYLASIEGKLI